MNVSIASRTPSFSEIVHGWLAAAWRRRFVIVVPLILMPVTGVVVGHYAPRTYEARMSILIQEPGKLNPFLEDLSVKTNLKERMEALRALLMSRFVLVAVAEDLGMIPREAPQQVQDRVVSDLSSAINVQLIGNEMVELRYRARSPVGIDKVLTQIGERFIERVQAPEDSSMRNSVSFLQNELRNATSRMDGAEAALATFKTENAQQLPDLRANNVQRLAQLRDQLSEHEVELAGAESQLASVRGRLAQTDPVIGRIEQDIVATLSELALLRARYTEAHSKVQAAERTLARLQEERASLLTASQSAVPADMDRMWNLAAAAQSSGDSKQPQPLLVSQMALMEQARTRVDLLRTETDNLRRAVRELSERVENGAAVERELRGHERDVEVAVDMVSQLRKRFEMAKVTGDLSRYQASDRIKIIDRPVEPTKPTRPMTLLFALGGLFGGIALGAGLAIMLELMDSSVRQIRQVEKLIGVPVLARIMPSARWRADRTRT